MTAQEADKVISEFMGEPFQECICGDAGAHYYESIDALVPVYFKLKETDIAQEGFTISFDIKSMRDESELREAAVITTAKAILELSNKH